jgi:soluble lytic murein transglycosylase-like protein
MGVRIKKRIEWGLRAATIGLWIFAAASMSQAQSAIPDSATMERARRYEPMIWKAARKYNVDPWALWVIANLETGFNPGLVSHRGARGMMQFMPETARRFGLVDPHDPEQLIEAAARYIQFLNRQFNDWMELVLAAYNSGEATVDAYLQGRRTRVGNRIINPRGQRTGGVPAYQETREHVKQGLKLLSIVRRNRPDDFVRDVIQRKVDPAKNALIQKSIRMNFTP